MCSSWIPRESRYIHSLHESTENESVCVACASMRWFIAIKTLTGFMRREFLANDSMCWYIFHSYAMFWFETSLAILDVDCFVPVYRRNPDNVPCFGTIFTRIPECPFRWCLLHATTLECRVFEPLLLSWSDTEMESSRPGSLFALPAGRPPGLDDISLSPRQYEQFRCLQFFCGF